MGQYSECGGGGRKEEKNNKTMRWEVGGKRVKEEKEKSTREIRGRRRRMRNRCSGWRRISKEGSRGKEENELGDRKGK
jgi:hypothetical protein